MVLGFEILGLVCLMFSILKWFFIFVLVWEFFELWVGEVGSSFFCWLGWELGWVWGR